MPDDSVQLPLSRLGASARAKLDAFAEREQLHASDYVIFLGRDWQLYTSNDLGEEICLGELGAE